MAAERLLTHPEAHVNLRTRAVLRLIEGFDRTEVVDATPAQRAASRRRRAPEVFPFDRVFGRVPRGTLRRDERRPRRPARCGCGSSSRPTAARPAR
nr:hypothetical protein [Angustibacter aerolatus]